MKHSKGFTLIEVIAILIIMSILAALFVSYMGTTYTQSPASAALVSDQYKLIQQMEILTVNYRKELQAAYDSNTTLNLCTFKTNYVDSMGINGVNIVNTANCEYQLTDSTSAYTTGNISVNGSDNKALLVTLTYKNQTLQSIFTK